jgi:sodium-dependent dicarboxylate transporter 2/3/5
LETQQIIDIDIDEPKIIKRTGLALGPVIAFIMIMSTPPEGMSSNAWHVSALAVWMGTWWITEAFPLAVTSLLPIFILPILNIQSVKTVASSFSSPIIFLFLGGFIISAAMQKYKLHIRLSLKLLNVVGNTPGLILMGLMMATAFLAFWMSNTATAIMMLPIAISIGALLTPDGKKSTGFQKALILAVAYSSALGGLGTFVGSPVNAILLGHLNESYNYSIDLTDWMKFGFPIVLLSVTSAWILLYFFFVRGTVLVTDAHERIAKEYEELGKVDRGQALVFFIFLLTVTLWLCSGKLEKLVGYKIEDAAIALFSAFLLFIIPVKVKPYTSLINWADAVRIPWGILVFFGGSLALSSALTSTGVTEWLSNELKMLQGINYILLIFIVCILIIAVSELMSNVATITAFLPILTGLAVALNVNPLLLMVPATLAASCGFMMPGASAPNALAFSTKKIKVTDMVKTGFLLNAAATIIIVIATFTIVSMVLGIEGSEMPEWAKIKAHGN